MRVNLIFIGLLLLMESCGPACRARGGRYIYVHFGTKRICDMPAKDAEKPCTDGSECEHDCVCPDEILEECWNLCMKDHVFQPDCPLPEEPAQGTCASFFFRGGLLCTIEEGRVAVDYVLVD
jgi:hypothetical protein